MQHQSHAYLFHQLMIQESLYSTSSNNVLLFDEEVENSICHSSVDFEQSRAFILHQNTLLNWLSDQSLLYQHVLFECNVETLTKLFFLLCQKCCLLLILLNRNILSGCTTSGTLKLKEKLLSSQSLLHKDHAQFLFYFSPLFFFCFKVTLQFILKFGILFSWTL